MPLASDMGGSWKILPIIVYVVRALRLTMLWSVRMDEWPLFGTTKFVIWQQIGWMKFAPRLRKSRSCNLYLVRTFFPEQRTGKKKPGRISKQKVFWCRQQSAFFDVRVFHPNAPSYRNTSIAALDRRQKQTKKREYGDRIREVEHGSFTPLVFSTTGGLSKETTVAYRRMAELLALKRKTEYSTTLAWMRCSLSFALLRSAISCISGTRASAHRTSDMRDNHVTESKPITWK